MREGAFAAVERIRRQPEHGTGVRTLEAEHATPSTERPAMITNLLCVWFVAQLFFTEKTTIGASPLVSALRPDRLVFIALVLYVLFGDPRRFVAGRRPSLVEGLMLTLFVALIGSALTSGAMPLNYHLSTVFTFIGFPMTCFWVARRMPIAAPNLRRLAAVMTGIGAYLGLCGICEHYNLPLFIFPSYIFNPEIGIHVGRARGPFVQAQAYGGVLVITAVMTFWYMSNVRRTIFHWLALALMVAGIYFSYTRAVWVDFALVVAVIGILSKAMRKWAVAISFAVLLVFVSGVFSKFSIYETTLFGRRSEAAQARVLLAQASLNMVQARPWLGVGYGTFVTAVNDYLDPETARLVIGEGNHNTVLGLAVEVGVVRAAPYVIVMLLCVGAAVRLYRLARRADRMARDFAITTLAILGGFLCLMQLGDIRFFSLLNSFVLTFSGICFAWLKLLKTAPSPQPAVAPSAAPTGFRQRRQASTSRGRFAVHRRIQ
jgi:hypothetical protein